MEKLKLSSILDSIITKRIHGNQMLHLQARHFADKNHNFNRHAKFKMTEQIGHIDIDKEKNKERLKQKENFWKLTLDTLRPKDLNQELD